MKIALINENSQAAKNEMICTTLKKVVEPMGHEVFNYGMCGAEDPNSLTYVQNGILAAVLLNSGAADYVITGCGTGEGAMLACNSFPKVLCGHIESPLDAYLFSQVNDGNCVALPFAENFGWGGELNLQYTFEKLFCAPGGGGYPPERVEPEQRNKKILDQVKEVTHTDMVTILKNLDQELVKGALSGEKFREYFFANCKCDRIAEAVKEVLAKGHMQMLTGSEAGRRLHALERQSRRGQKGVIMHAVLEQISKIGIVPVVKIDREEDALPLAKALCAGGLPCAEVTFRTDAAAGAIKIMTENFPDMCVGAGTVLNAGQVDAAVAAGAKFIVSPGLNPRTVQYCIDKGVPVTPGTSSPSDIEQAIEFGLEVVKFFPAEQSGGLAKIKAMAAPYVNMKFMPTGGVNAKNLTSYLDFPKIIACGGSWMVPGDLINEGAWDKIEQLTREAVQTMLGFELAHVGINAANEEEAIKAANRFAFLFGMPAKVGNSSVFAGTAVEVMKEPFKGANGHIAIRTNYIERAVNYMSTVLGVEFEEPKRDEKGKYKAIYLKEEVGGFAVHLVQK